VLLALELLLLPALPRHLRYIHHAAGLHDAGDHLLDRGCWNYESFDATNDAIFSTDGTGLRLWSITAVMGDEIFCYVQLERTTCGPT
jgi:hypothetical protein